MTDDRRRRTDDDRIEELVNVTTLLDTKVDSIRDMLIGEPSASPLGRALLEKAADNRRVIDRNHEEFRTFVKEDFRPLNDWWNQSKGAWKFLLGLGTVLGIIGSFFGILSFFGPR